MVRYAVLLRAVNLGSHQKVAMPELKRTLETLGYTDVTTYLQSGNAVVTSAEADPRRLELDIRQGLREKLELDTPIMVRTGPELAAVIADNPFPETVATPTRLHVAFLSAQPDAANVAKVDPARFAPDEFRLGDRALYLRYETGAGRSKLTASAFGRLGVDATARNWNTVMALAGLTASG